MPPEDRKTKYLDQAKEAKEQAENTKDEAIKAYWLELAAEYHRLAAQQGASTP